MTMSLIFPHRGEFGSKIFWHAPAVNAIEGDKVICIEPGDEALYPGASYYLDVSQRDDGNRRSSPGRDQKFMVELSSQLKEHYKDYPQVSVTAQAPLKYFVPTPYRKASVPNYIEVVICPRKRAYGATKNWSGWGELAQSFETLGLSTFAAGTKETSFPVSCPSAWEFTRELDASIAAILRANLVIATDAGLAHLAVLCGKPLLLISYRELTAPGPQVDQNGRILKNSYGRIDLARYQRTNHLKSPIAVVDGWEDVSFVIDSAVKLLQTT